MSGGDVCFRPVKVRFGSEIGGKHDLLGLV